MPDPIFEILKFASPSAVALLFLWKVVIPWSDSLLLKRENGKMEQRMHNLETNDIPHCQQTRDEFLSFQKEMRISISSLHTRVNELSDRVSRMEGKMNGRA